jgi:tagatose 6-phosphate kinase
LLKALEAKPGLVKPNRAELLTTMTAKQSIPTTRQSIEPTTKRAMIRLSELGAQRVVVTAGNKPTLAFDGNTFWRIISPSIKVVNPIGSGDSFTAALVWRLLRGDDLGQACRWGAAAGAANALTLMPGELRRKDMAELLREVRLSKERSWLTWRAVTVRGS